MPSQSSAPKQKGTELSRFLTAARVEARLSPKDVAMAISVALSVLEAYESGKQKPTRLILDRLTAALGCEDLATRFPPVPPIKARQLAMPANVALRLQHLVNVVAEGHQRRFAIGAGLHEGSISPLINEKVQLQPSQIRKVLGALPTLNEEWLRTGKGQPFPAGPVPAFPVVAPKPKTERVVPANRWVAVREMRVAVIPSLDPWDPARRNAVGLTLLDSLIERLSWVNERECGLTPDQVKSVVDLLLQASGTL